MLVLLILQNLILGQKKFICAAKKKIQTFQIQIQKFKFKHSNFDTL